MKYVDPQHFSIIAPCDMHHHFRDGAMLEITAPPVAERFHAAVAMPNLKGNYLTTYDQLVIYHEKLREKLPTTISLMTLYFSDKLTAATIEETATLAPLKLLGVKYYPRGVTTNSDEGLTNPTDMWTAGTKAHDIIEQLQQHNLALLLHAADRVDVYGVELDPFDQETHFLNNTLPRLLDAWPNLKISIEHCSTLQAARLFLDKKLPSNVGCSLTPQHLLLDRRDLFRGGFNRNRFWIPVLQASEHKEALRELAFANQPNVWLGSDSAPHALKDKSAPCCPGGVMTSHAGIEVHTEVFADLEVGITEKRVAQLERFASYNAPEFFGFTPSRLSIELEHKPWRVYGRNLGFELPDDSVEPFRLGEMIDWKLSKGLI